MWQRVIAVLLSVLLMAAYAFWAMPAEPLAATDSRYQKIDNQGQTLAAWAGPWSCVLDHKTGLIWEVKAPPKSAYS